MGVTRRGVRSSPARPTSHRGLRGKGIAVVLILLWIAAAVVVGLLAGGRLRDFPTVRLRWGWLAAIGIVLQYVWIRGPFALPVLLASYAVLLFFVATNLRAPGFGVILVGLALNALVIATNQGMPVTQHALDASGQAGAISSLRSNAEGQKHVLAGDGTELLPLADVIAIGGPVDEVVSIGDVFLYTGIAWFVIAAMRKPRGARTSAAEALEGRP